MTRLHATILLSCALSISSCIKAEETKPSEEKAVPQAQDREGIFGKTTAEIVEVKQAMAENPDLKIFQRQGLGNDPLSQYANAYIYLSSEIQMQNMKHQLDILKVDNDFKNLNYTQFMKFVKDNNFQFSMLKPWQKYGYNEETGSMVILQDEAEKKRRFQAAGIEDQYKEGTL